jgi:hypothetical protein
MAKRSMAKHHSASLTEAEIREHNLWQLRTGNKDFHVVLTKETVEEGLREGLDAGELMVRAVRRCIPGATGVKVTFTFKLEDGPIIDGGPTPTGISI